MTDVSSIREVEVRFGQTVRHKPSDLLGRVVDLGERDVKFGLPWAMLEFPRGSRIPFFLSSLEVL